MPNGLKLIGTAPFSGNPERVIEIGMSAFENDIIQGKLDATVRGAFRNCTRLRKIGTHRATKIEEEAFASTSISLQSPTTPVASGKRLPYPEYPLRKETPFDLIRNTIGNQQIKSFSDIKSLINKNELDREGRVRMWVTISKAFLEWSNQIAWRQEGEVEWRFDYRIGRVIIKGHG